MSYAFVKGKGAEAVFGTQLVARIVVPGVHLDHEIWKSPAPTDCDARVEGDAMLVHCITDEGQLTARLRVSGEAVLIELAAQGPPMVVPAPALAFGEPVAKAAVPCGTTLKFRPVSKEFH